MAYTTFWTQRPSLRKEKGFTATWTLARVSDIFTGAPATGANGKSTMIMTPSIRELISLPHKVNYQQVLDTIGWAHGHSHRNHKSKSTTAKSFQVALWSVEVHPNRAGVMAYINFLMQRPSLLKEREFTAT
jgi:hypothetical protein